METSSQQNQKNRLPDMDSNHDKQIQRLLCYRYTIRQRQRKGNPFVCGVKPSSIIRRRHA